MTGGSAVRSSALFMGVVPYKVIQPQVNRNIVMVFMFHEKLVGLGNMVYVWSVEGFFWVPY